MSSTPPWTTAIPELRFAVLEAESVPYAAVPTIRLPLQIEAAGEQSIRSVLLEVQLQIAARARGYSAAEGERLLELFGAPERWGTTLRTLPWTRTTLVVPAFIGTTVVDLLVACSYDLEVTAARYLAALQGGEIPLELLFSGSVFFAGEERALQAARIPWDSEVSYGLPVTVWRQAIDQHFPDSAWLRLSRDAFDRLCGYKARHAFSSWEEAIDSLLGYEERS